MASEIESIMRPATLKLTPRAGENCLWFRQIRCPNEPADREPSFINKASHLRFEHLSLELANV